jgi:hypothetical protein
MFTFVAGSEIQIINRSFLRFLDEAVQQHHTIPFIDKKRTRAIRLLLRVVRTSYNP